MSHIAVFGAGSWGTAFASILAADDNDVRVWGRRQGLVDQLNAGVNDDYLPGVALPSRISASTDPAAGSAGGLAMALSAALRKYDGLWFGPLKRSLDAFIESTQEHVTGDIRLVGLYVAGAAVLSIIALLFVQEHTSTQDLAERIHD